MWAPDLFTLNNYVVIRHADTNSHSSTYFLVTNIFIRILNVLIHSHSRSYDFYSTLAFFIQHSLICKIHKFRIPSLWTINFFFHEYVHSYSRHIFNYIQRQNLLFNQELLIQFIQHFARISLYASFDPRLLSLGSIFWKQATHLADLESTIRRRSR